jgi:hypothetical protein
MSKDTELAARQKGDRLTHGRSKKASRKKCARMLFENIADKLYDTFESMIVEEGKAMLHVHNMV